MNEYARNWAFASGRLAGITSVWRYGSVWQKQQWRKKRRVHAGDPSLNPGGGGTRKYRIAVDGVGLEAYECLMQ
jgi:hypothetical protein